MATNLVQTANSGTPSGTATVKTATFASPQIAQHLNVISIAFGLPAVNSFTPPTITVTDSKGNTYTAVGPSIQHTGPSPQTVLSVVYYCPNIAAANAGQNTVTVTLGSAFSFFIIGIFEFNLVGATVDNYSNNSSASGLAVSTPSITTTGANDVFFGLSECTTGPQNVNSPYTSIMLQYIMQVGANVAPAGTYNFTAVSTGPTAGWAAWLVAFKGSVILPPAPSAIGTEVLLTQSMSASEDFPSNMQDADSWTWWHNTSFPAWAQIDAATPVVLTRLRVSPIGGGEDLPIGGTITASNSATFASGVATLFTFTKRLVTGTLLNEYPVSPGVAYQYYRYNAPTTQNDLSDLDFICLNTPGLWGAPVRPVLFPTQAQYDFPTYFTLSTITADAKIYYTLDGTVPSTSSNLYSGPILISANCTLNAVAISPAGGTSRVISYPVHIVNTEVSVDNIYDDRGYRLWSFNGDIYQDPISKYWYRYGIGDDTPGVYAYGAGGNYIYRSADLRNWTYRGVCNAPPPGQANTAYNIYDIAIHVLYNAANHNYVFWTDNYTAISINSFTWNGKCVYTSPTPEGPLTLVATYLTIPGVAGQPPAGDFCLFQDTDGVTAYLVTTTNANASINIIKLDSTYTAFSGNGVAYTYASIGFTGASGKFEAPLMFWNGSKYILAVSNEERFTATMTPTLYATGSSPMGIFTNVGNPFVPVSGGNPDYTTSYNSQIWKILYIPGRNAYIYHGDRYDVANNNFYNSRRIRLPVTWLPNGVMNINWNPAWSFDAQFPTLSGAPSAPSQLRVYNNGTSATWNNNEQFPCKLYFDFAADPTFATVLGSCVLPDGASSITGGLPSFPAGSYFRLRAVNANGWSASPAVASLSGGADAMNPPFMPVVFPPGPPTTVVWEDGPGIYAFPSNSGSPLRYNGQTQQRVINTASPKPPTLRLPSAADKNISKVK